MTAAPAPGPHGGDVEAIARHLGVAVADLLDLSVSLNPVAPDAAAVVGRHLDAIHRYPDDRAATSSLAQALGVDPVRLVLTNGGAEAIALVARAHPVGRVDEPEFSLYRRHLRTVDPSGHRWMSDPNNPTGRLADEDERAFVRDEAFYALATGRWTRGDDGCFVVGSLTKLFACPGLRLGYVLAPDDRAAAALAEDRPRWSVSTLAAAALPDLLAGADLPGWCRGIADLRHDLISLLAEHGVAASGTANFVWAPSAPGLRERLLAHRVIVRSGASFGSPDAVRIGVPGPDGLHRLAAALRAGASEPSPPATGTVVSPTSPAGRRQTHGRKSSPPPPDRPTRTRTEEPA
jgi:histidinol-phosphate/aromatic aminotransferase/cobyric acid decarboxylase-like protein